MKPTPLLMLLSGCLFVGSGLGSSPVHAEVYQWRDENGRLHFSDEPPDGQKSEQVDLKPASGYSPPSAHREAGRYVVQDSMRKHRSSGPSRALKSYRTQEEASRKARRKASCRSARDRYRNISVRNGWAYREKKDRLRKRIKEYCH